MSSNERRYRPTKYTDYILPFDATTRSENRQIRGFPPSPDRNNPYYRRRTADNFLVPEPVHIAPTVARSSLTASASINDLSMDSKNNLLPLNYICQPVLTPVDIGKQISQQNRPRFPLIKKFTPTRIPSPVWNATIKDRHVSIPVLPSQKLLKEVSPLNKPLHICQMEMFIIECILPIPTPRVFLLFLTTCSE